MSRAAASSAGTIRSGASCPTTSSARFTHRLGSLHAVHIPGASQPLSMWHRELPHELTPAAYMALHMDELERFAAEMPVDILSHPTLLPLPLRELPCG